MGMRRQLANGHGVSLLSPTFPQGMPAADMNRRPTAKVGECEVHPSVASKGSPQEREQSLVLVDGQELTIAKRPPLWSKHKAHDSNLRQKRLSHTPPF